MQRRATLIPAMVAVVLLAGCTATDSPTSASTPPPASASAPASDPVPSGSSSIGSGSAATSLGYHGGTALTGAVPAGASLDHARKAWSADLGGVVHGQPVVADGLVIAATERNRVVALDPKTGQVKWSRTLGAPLTDVGAAAGCGNIDPLGITSTPAIDPATHTVYVSARSVAVAALCSTSSPVSASRPGGRCCPNPSIRSFPPGRRR